MAHLSITYPMSERVPRGSHPAPCLFGRLPNEAVDAAWELRSWRLPGGDDPHPLRLDREAMSDLSDPIAQSANPELLHPGQELWKLKAHGLHPGCGEQLNYPSTR